MFILTNKNTLKKLKSSIYVAWLLKEETVHKYRKNGAMIIKQSIVGNLTLLAAMAMRIDSRRDINARKFAKYQNEEVINNYLIN